MGSNSSISNEEYNYDEEHNYAYLFIYIKDENLKELYKKHVENHNKKISGPQWDLADAGFDLLSPNRVEIGVGEKKTIDYEIICKMTQFDKNNNCHKTGFFVYPRSSISKTPLMLANSAGVIDSPYRGNLKSVFRNVENTEYVIEKGDRLVQIVNPVMKPIYATLKDNLDEFEITERGDGGFGSTGIGLSSQFSQSKSG